MFSDLNKIEFIQIYDDKLKHILKYRSNPKLLDIMENIQTVIQNEN